MKSATLFSENFHGNGSCGWIGRLESSSHGRLRKKNVENQPRECVSRQIAEEKRGESPERAPLRLDCERKAWRINRESACHG